jgi:hypothetical protein
MKLLSQYKHLFGVAICTLLMFGVMLAASFLAISVFPVGSTSDYSYSRFQVFMADTGTVVVVALLWPGEQFRLGDATWYVLPVVYGIVLYGAFITVRRRAA